MFQAVLFCLVTAVTDGDTLKVRCGDKGAYQQINIRLAEIDAPERRQPFGERSKQSLASICFQKEAAITQQTKDRYGRTVALVTCDGVDANREQVKRGMAWVYDQYVKDQSLYAIQAEAKKARQGLWIDEQPIPPWNWRKTKQNRVHAERG